jgi:hypothetical protein
MPGRPRQNPALRDPACGADYVAQTAEMSHEVRLIAGSQAHAGATSPNWVMFKLRLMARGRNQI